MLGRSTSAPQTITCRQAINRCARRRGFVGRSSGPDSGGYRDRSSAPLVLRRDCSEVLPDDGGSAFSMDLL